MASVTIVVAVAIAFSSSTCSSMMSEVVEDCEQSPASAVAFSYFSISSASSTDSHQLSKYVKCLKSTLKWRSIVLQNRNKSEKSGAGGCELSEDDVNFLTENTNFTEPEIREWWREFLMDCPEGVLTRTKLQEMLITILPADNCNIITDLIFNTFDRDGDGWIDFKEFIIATDLTASSSPEDKLRWVFKLYDKDGSDSIQLREMLEVFATLYLNEGVNEDLAIERATKIFSFLDANNDGDISEDEFVQGCLKDEDLVTLLEDDSVDPPLMFLKSASSTPREYSKEETEAEVLDKSLWFGVKY